MPGMGYVAFGAQVLLCVTFAVAAVAKLRDLAGFRESLDRLLPLAHTLPAGTRMTAAAVVPVAELTIAALLVVPGAATIGTVAALLMTVGFTAVVGLALRRGDRAPCRCFGASERRLGPQHLVRNVLLTVFAALGLAGGATEPAGLLVAGFAGVVGALLVVWADDIAGLFGPGPAYRR
ncbi:methylamine utilization protein MauE [Dactylosporangium siamense]|uniref:Methylamine utilization protein MauE n=2 Tax=Dactylosporangium siamense TaxID=685454 RepID=A0A919UC55_9ACTN|nr:methylamine utilization protein MauE [Dactylosporangium siamense]